MKINLNKKELKSLQRAMRRVGDELNLHDTTSTQFEQFVEDVRLILFEMWVILKKHGF